ncbi:hypothetical protein D5086_021675 [Populus alba]|uniref:Uncharacterized protein n=1 Tax=Populus alba TaxID=43335 RepID=A0ACC4BDH0_POPAL
MKLGFIQSIERGICSAHPQLLLHSLLQDLVSTLQPPPSLLGHDMAPPAKIGSLNSRFGAGNPNSKPTVGTAPSLPLKQAVAIEERAGRSECKGAKLASWLGTPDASSGSPQVVHVSEDHSDATAALPPRGQYLTRRKVAASSAFGRTGKSGQPFKRSSSADSKIQGSIASTPSSSL